MLHFTLPFRYTSCMKRVLVLYGGKSGEHEVSLRSAASIVRNLMGRYELSLVGITKTGVWYLQPESYLAHVASKDIETLEIQQDPLKKVSLFPGEGLVCNGAHLKTDIVFPVLHGTFGEDGTLQGLLETIGIAYVGAGVLGSALGMDKEKSKQLWEQEKLPIVPYLSLLKQGWKDQLSQVLPQVQALGYPLFVKPACIGSSVAISKVKDPAGLPRALERAFAFDTKVLIEKGIDAREIECSVLGNYDPIACTPGEVISSHEFYDYEAKYLDPHGAELRIPAAVSESLLNRIRELAVHAYKAISGEGMARVDFFLDKTTGDLYLNEINTIPGFTSISMFPRMCAHDKITFPALLDRLIKLGLERYEERTALCYDYQKDTPVTYQ